MDIILDVRQEFFPVVVSNEVFQLAAFFYDARRLFVKSEPVLAHDEPVPRSLFGNGNIVDSRHFSAVRFGEFLDGIVTFVDRFEIIGRIFFDIFGQIPDHAVGNALFYAARISGADLHVAYEHYVVILIVARPHLLNVVIHAVRIFDFDARALFEFLINAELVVACVSADDFERQENLYGIRIFRFLARARRSDDTERQQYAHDNADKFSFHLCFLLLFTRSAVEFVYDRRHLRAGNFHD